LSTGRIGRQKAYDAGTFLNIAETILVPTRSTLDQVGVILSLGNSDLDLCIDQVASPVLEVAVPASLPAGRSIRPYRLDQALLDDSRIEVDIDDTEAVVKVAESAVIVTRRTVVEDWSAVIVESVPASLNQGEIRVNLDRGALLVFDVAETTVDPAWGALDKLAVSVIIVPVTSEEIQANV